AGFLVHLVLDRVAADRHLDDDVDVLGRVVANGDGVDAHELFLLRLGQSRQRRDAAGRNHESKGTEHRRRFGSAGNALTVILPPVRIYRPQRYCNAADGDRTVCQFQTKATLRRALASNTSTPSATSRPP